MRESTAHWQLPGSPEAKEAELLASRGTAPGAQPKAMSPHTHTEISSFHRVLVWTGASVARTEQGTQDRAGKSCRLARG